MVAPAKSVTGPGALLYLEDDPLLARAALRYLFPKIVPDCEVAWVDQLALARHAIAKWPRLAGFVLDYRIGRETSAELIEALRRLYPPPTPVCLLTGFGLDPVVLRIATRHDAILIDKGSAELHFARFPQLLAESRARVLALRARLSHLACPEVLTERELQVAEALAAGLVPRALEGALEMGESQRRARVRELLRKTGCPTVEVLVARAHQ